MVRSNEIFSVNSETFQKYIVFNFFFQLVCSATVEFIQKNTIFVTTPPSHKFVAQTKFKNDKNEILQNIWLLSKKWETT